MDLKKVTQKLAQIRDIAREEGRLTKKEKEELKQLVAETITISQRNLKGTNRSNIMPMPQKAENDNHQLTADQNFRLRLMEKTGTGSHAIH